MGTGNEPPDCGHGANATSEMQLKIRHSASPSGKSLSPLQLMPAWIRQTTAIAHQNQDEEWPNLAAPDENAYPRVPKLSTAVGQNGLSTRVCLRGKQQVQDPETWD